MIMRLERFLGLLLNIAISLHFANAPFSPTLSRLRARGLKLNQIGALAKKIALSIFCVRDLKPRALAYITSPASGRECANFAIAPYLIRGWVRGYLPKVQRLTHAS